VGNAAVAHDWGTFPTDIACHGCLGNNLAPRPCVDGPFCRKAASAGALVSDSNFATKTNGFSMEPLGCKGFGVFIDPGETFTTLPSQL
jgi:hypothetical protein